MSNLHETRVAAGDTVGKILTTIVDPDDAAAKVASWEATAGGPPSGAAGGVLSGTYPDPGFAVDMATQAELDAHVGDTTDAHDASAISFTPTGTIAATDVQAAIAEVASEAGGGGSAHVIEDEGTPLTARANLNFVGAGVTATDDSANNRTVVTIPAGGGGGGLSWTKEIDNAGTSLTGWSTNGTTWSVNTYIQVVSNSGAFRTARFDTNLTDAAAYATSVEFESQAGDHGAGEYIFLALIPAATAAYSATAGLAARVQGRTSIDLETGGSNQAFTISSLADGFHELTVFYIGGLITAFIDDVVVARRAAVATPTLGEGWRPAVGCYGTITTRFRNLKAWTADSFSTADLPA